MIIVKLMGGLGNQMFQYAVGRQISLIKNKPLKLDLGWFSTVSQDTERNYELAVFNIAKSIASSNEINKMIEFKLGGKVKLRCRILRALLPNYKHSHIIEKCCNFDREILKLEDNVYLEGYWHSEKYFKDIENVIRQEFTIRSEPDALNKEAAGKIMACESVSVHIRRGDYVSDKKTNEHHGTCSLEYYNNAVNIITKEIKDPHFFAFSDDPVWVQENLQLKFPTTYIDFNGTEKAYEDLRLMSLCKHHIIANSSFSWWGAWLNRNTDKIVIAPSRWFNDSTINTTDIIPDSWLRI